MDDESNGVVRTNYGWLGDGRRFVVVHVCIEPTGALLGIYFGDRLSSSLPYAIPASNGANLNVDRHCFDARIQS
jgi:hypothetical protein